METKFKVGDKVLINDCVNRKHVGKIGKVIDVIPVFESQEQVDDEKYIGKFSLKSYGDTSTGYYKVQCDGKKLRYYATDDCLERVNN